MIILKDEELKLCPFCESLLMLMQDGHNGGVPYLECRTCGLRFRTDGFHEKPVELHFEEETK